MCVSKTKSLKQRILRYLTGNHAYIVFFSFIIFDIERIEQMAITFVTCNKEFSVQN